MAHWTYTGDDPSASSLNKVRFLLGDTNEQQPQLNDEEINFLLTENDSDPYRAAAAGAIALSAKYTREVSKTVGPLSIQAQMRADAYRELAASIMEQATGSGAFATALVPTPYAGGIRISDKETDEEDDDLVEPAFRLDDMSYEGAGDDEATREH